MVRVNNMRAAIIVKRYPLIPKVVLVNQRFFASQIRAKRLQSFTLTENTSFKVSGFEKWLESRFEKNMSIRQLRKKKQDISWSDSLIYPKVNLLESELRSTILPTALDKLIKVESDSGKSVRFDAVALCVAMIHSAGTLTLLPFTSSLALISLLLPERMAKTWKTPFISSCEILGTYLAVFLLGLHGIIRFVFTPRRQIDCEKLLSLVSIYSEDFSAPELIALAKVIEMYYAQRILTKGIYQKALLKGDSLWTPVLLIETAILFPISTASTHRDLLRAIELIQSYPDGLSCYSEYLEVARANLKLIEDHWKLNPRDMISDCSESRTINFKHR